jgi:hypothetical protein
LATSWALLLLLLLLHPSSQLLVLLLQLDWACQVQTIPDQQPPLQLLLRLVLH